MVTILSIVFVRSMACILLDDGQKVWLTHADFLESGWREGLSVDRKDFERFVSLHQYPRALNQAVALLARRPCSKGEISQSLRRHHYADDVTELVIYKLEKENLLNDQEFSELWVQQRSRNRQPKKHFPLSAMRKCWKAQLPWPSKHGPEQNPVRIPVKPAKGSFLLSSAKGSTGTWPARPPTPPNPKRYSERREQGDMPFLFSECET